MLRALRLVSCRHHQIRVIRLNPPWLSFPNRSSSYSTATTRMDNITHVLSALSITPVTSVAHSETNSPASWKDALSAAPVPFNLIKTLVYKPKTAKSAVPVPVIVVAHEDTETSSTTLGKKLNLKELRLASEDLLTEFFSLDKHSRTSSIRLDPALH